MRTERVVWPWLCACTITLSLLTGCPGKLDDKERFLVDAALADGADADAVAPNDAGSNLGACGDVVARVFVPSCGGTGCHGVTASQDGLDLVSAGVAARVVGISAKECAATLAY